MLKGGVLLAAYDARRPTRDIDLAAVAVPDNFDYLRQMINEIIAIRRDDGLEFDLDATGVEAIRDEEDYGGARATIHGRLSTGVIQFHVDVSLGDPLWPAPDEVDVPRVLAGQPIRVRGYRVELILAEKIVTALQRGAANTRWRDFVDIANLARHDLDDKALAESMRRVADYRLVAIEPLRAVLAGYPPIAQSRWSAWRRKQRLDDSTPEQFADLLEQVLSFADSVLQRAGTAR